MSVLPHLNLVAEQPAENYIDRRIADLRIALREQPEDKLRLKQELLIFMHIKEDVDETINLAIELLALDVDKIYAFDCYHILARMYVKKEDTSTAIEYYRKAIDADPTAMESITELAALYEKQFDYDAALAVYDYLDNECFDDMKYDMYCYKAVCYYNKNEFEKALEFFQASHALPGYDKNVELINDIGACFYNLKNYIEAFNQFRKSLEIDSQSAVAHYGMGLCYQHTDDGYRAMHHYFEAVTLKPDYTDAYNNIAAVTINQDGDYQTGIEMLKKAIDTCPEKKSLTLVYLNLTHIYKRLCEFTLADYYKAEYMKSMGFDVSFEEDDDDED